MKEVTNFRTEMAKLGAVVLQSGTVHEAAATFLDLPFLMGNVLTFRHTTLLWNGHRWGTPESFDLPDYVRLFLGKCQVQMGRGQLAPMNTPSSVVNSVVSMIQALTRVEMTAEDTLPMWVGRGEAPFDRDWSLSLEDVVVDMSTGQTFERTKDWCDPVVIPVTLAELNDAPTPTVFERTLAQWSDGDDAWTELLLRMTAYLAMPGRDLQRAFMLVGKKRAGKGVWTRIIERLMGVENIFSTDMERFVYSHGLEGAERARVVLLNEVGESSVDVSGKIRRYANTIIGRDRMTINPKGKTLFSARLAAALVLVGNEIPDVEDHANSFWDKVCILPYRRSFFGHENPHLERDLWNERASIVRAVVAAGQRLSNDGRFPEPAAVNTTREQLRRLNSPIDAFVHDRCNLNPRLSVTKDEIFAEYEEWAKFYEVTPLPRNIFFRKLNGSTLPIETRRMGPRGNQTPRIVGLGLAPLKDRGGWEDDAPQETPNGQ
jgi:putative DNA primase/helicase